MGQKLYFSLLKYTNVVIGNSSSGYSEVPSFKKPTIDLGTRQKGRIAATSVINLESVNKKNLKKAFKKINSYKFKKILFKTRNPYFKKNTTDNIISILKKLDLKKTSKKEFLDI